MLSPSGWRLSLTNLASAVVVTATRSAVSSSRSQMSGICLLGTTRRWPKTAGSVGRKAITLASRKTSRTSGSVRFAISQNGQLEPCSCIPGDPVLKILLDVTEGCPQRCPRVHEFHSVLSKRNSMLIRDDVKGIYPSSLGVSIRIFQSIDSHSDERSPVIPGLFDFVPDPATLGCGFTD